MIPLGSRANRTLRPTPSSKPKIFSKFPSRICVQLRPKSAGWTHKLTCWLADLLTPLTPGAPLTPFSLISANNSFRIQYLQPRPLVKSLKINHFPTEIRGGGGRRYPWARNAVKSSRAETNAGREAPLRHPPGTAGRARTRRPQGLHVPRAVRFSAVSTCLAERAAYWRRRWHIRRSRWKEKRLRTGSAS